MTRWRRSGQPDVSILAEEQCASCGVLLPLDQRGQPEGHACCACLDWGQVAGVPCSSCAREVAADETWRRMGIPSIFANATLLNWEPQDGAPVRLCHDFIAAWPPDPWMVLLVGGTGAGKSHLAAAVLKHAWQSHRRAGRFVKTQAMLNRFRATKTPESEEHEADVLREYVMTPLLVVDELGFGRITDYAQEAVYAVVDGRWAERMPTIVTMNADGLSAIDPRIRSRVASGLVVEFTGKDRRVSA